MVGAGRRWWWAGAAVALLAGCEGLITDPGDTGRSGRVVPPGGCEGEACRDIAETPPPSSRFPRLTHAQWEQTVTDLFRLDAPLGLSAELDADPTIGAFDTDERRLGVTAGLWRDYQRAAEAIAEIATDDTHLAAWLPGSLPSDGAARRDAFVASFGARAYRRPLTTVEIARLAAVFDEGPTHFPSMDPFVAGARIVVEGVLQSPNFTYRVERSRTIADGLVALDGHELASRLSYLLWDSMPDDELFAAAAAGELATPDALRSQVERMFDDPRASAKMGRFHDAVFQIDEWSRYTHDLPEWSPALTAKMQEEARLFIDDVLVNGGTIRDLLVSNVAFVDEELAGLYGVDGVTGTDYQRVELDPGERAGILTRLGFLTKNTDTQPDPVHRGLFVAERILCRELPPPPLFDPAEHVPMGDTNRERYESITGPGTCGAGCHATIINPLGFAFESYDALGRFRTDDDGHPIDDAASYTTEDGETLEYAGGVELSQSIADLASVHECYAEHLLEFAYGRGVSDGDSPLLFRAGEVSHNGGSIRDVVMELVESRSFRFRSPVELEATATEEASP